MTNEKGITYFSIPGEVAFNPSLNYTDLRVWWEANLLDTSPRHCYASNNRIAYVLGISKASVKRSIKKLIEQGYFISNKYDYKTQERTIKVNKDLNDYRHFIEEYNDRRKAQKRAWESSKMGQEKAQKRAINKNNSINTKKNKSIINYTMSHKGETTGNFIKLSCKGITLPDEYHEILDLYYKSIGRKIPASTTKVLRKDRDALKDLRRGILFKNWPRFYEFNRKYSYDEIKELIKLHALALNPEYELPNKKHYKVYFHKFLLNDYIQKSYFCKWQKDPPKHGGVIHSNPYPEMTDVFLKFLSNGKPIKPKEMNKLIKAAKLTVQYFKDRPEELRSFYRSRQAQAEILVEAVKTDDTIKNHITAGYLCSDLTFDRRLPDYCERNVVFEQPKYTGYRG